MKIRALALLTALTASTLGFSTPSQAGLIIGNGSLVTTGAIMIVVGGTTAILMDKDCWTELEETLYYGGIGVGAVGVGLLVLDGKDMAPEIENVVKNRYPFIDDAEAVHGIAARIADKLATVDVRGDANAHFEFKLGEESVRSLLLETSLTAEQIEHVVADLN